MECMAYIYHDSAKAGSKYEVFGDLKMSQRTPLAHRGTDDRFDVGFLYNIIFISDLKCVNVKALPYSITL